MPAAQGRNRSSTPRNSLLSCFQLPGSPSIADGWPSASGTKLISADQAERRLSKDGEVGKGYANSLLFSVPRSCHITLLLVSHQQEFRHMVTSSARRVRDVIFILGDHVPT